MTREELQRLYDRYQAHGFYGHLTALVTALGTFLDQPDPTVEIAYLKAKLADAEAGRDQGAVKALTARAEAAEQAVQRVRWQCEWWSHGNSWNKAARNAILRALDGGAS